MHSIRKDGVPFYLSDTMHFEWPDAERQGICADKIEIYGGSLIVVKGTVSINFR